MRARTNRLMERGILQIVGVADPHKLGFQHGADRHPLRARQAPRGGGGLAEMPEVDYVVVTAGSYDVLIESVAEDNEALLHFLADRLQQDRRRARDGDVRRTCAS